MRTPLLGSGTVSGITWPHIEAPVTGVEMTGLPRWCQLTSEVSVLLSLQGTRLCTQLPLTSKGSEIQTLLVPFRGSFDSSDPKSDFLLVYFFFFK